MTNRKDGTGSVMTAKSRLIADLSPVTDFLADSARRRGEQIVSEAAAQAENTLAEARQQADARLATARERGATLARRSALAVVANARREARQEVLGAQRLVYEQVRTQVLDRLRQLARSPEAAALNARLREVARERLGDEATLVAPEGEIGVVAHCGERSLDLKTDALVERVMASVGEEISELWS